MNLKKLCIFLKKVILEIPFFIQTVMPKIKKKGKKTFSNDNELRYDISDEIFSHW